MVTRAEHIKWCKKRAHDEYDFYKTKEPESALRNAVASMLSDLGKHAETEILQQTALMIGLTVKDEASLFYFIDGFRE